MEIMVCEECSDGYVYVDSPPAKKCFCGGSLVETSAYEEIIKGKIRHIDNVDYPTVSC